MLCKEIHSEKKIFSNIYIIALQLAERINVYMSYLHQIENCFLNHSEVEQENVFQTLKRIHSKITQQIKRLTNWSKYYF